ncbi:MAG: hypothetical protein ABWY49_05975, partial [Rhizobium sp.]
MRRDETVAREANLSNFTENTGPPPRQSISQMGPLRRTVVPPKQRARWQWPWAARSGTVRHLYLIGIGTGNPEHMTVQGINALNAA